MNTNPDLEARNALAAATFPLAWAKAVAAGAKGGRTRHRLRQQAEAAMKLKALREQGASCSNCDSRGRWNGKIICDARSDHEGYALTRMDALCVTWSPA